MRIERITDLSTVEAGAALFDAPPLPLAAARFLNDPGHHLLFAYDEPGTDPPDRGPAVGFVSGVELTHPDKGTEMYLNELGVAGPARGRGVATQLVKALAALAQERGCYAMWAATEPDNDGALATYRRAGARDEAPAVVFAWEF